MKKQSIMAVPVFCFWAVTATCLLGIIIGSFYDFSINEVLANKTDLGAFFATTDHLSDLCRREPGLSVVDRDGLNKSGCH